MKKIISVIGLGMLLMCSVAYAGTPNVSVDRSIQELRLEMNQTQVDVALLKEQQNRQILTKGDVGVKVIPEYNPFYVSVGGAWMFDTNDSVSSSGVDAREEWMAQVAIGKKFGMFRTEVEYGYQDTSILHKNSDINSILVNGYVDFPVYDKVSLYGQLGAGAGVLSVDGFNSTTAFMSSAGAGVVVSVSDNVDANVGYRFMSMADTNVNGVDVSYNSSMITTGLAYKF